MRREPKLEGETWADWAWILATEPLGWSWSDGSEEEIGYWADRDWGKKLGKRFGEKKKSFDEEVGGGGE